MYHHEKLNTNLILKSGANFGNLSLLTLTPLTEGSSSEEKLNEPQEPITDNNVRSHEVYQYFIKNKYLGTIQKFDVVNSGKVDPSIEIHIEKFAKEMTKKMMTIEGILECDVDVSFAKIRTEENEGGNFFTDLMRKYHASDGAILNSGNIRADRIIKSGPFVMGDLYDGIALHVPVVKLKMNGKLLLSILENSVSAYPKLEGRFSHYSGIKFAFDPSQKPGERIAQESILIQGLPLNLEREYTVATAEYISLGKDGFSAFLEAEVGVDGENALSIKQVTLEFLRLFEDENHLKERELILRYKEYFTTEFIKKCAKDKLRRAHVKIQSLGKFGFDPDKIKDLGLKKSPLKDNLEERGFKRSLSLGLIDEGMINTIIQNKEAPNLVCGRR